MFSKLKITLLIVGIVAVNVGIGVVVYSVDDYSTIPKNFPGWLRKQLVTAESFLGREQRLWLAEHMPAVSSLRMICTREKSDSSRQVYFAGEPIDLEAAESLVCSGGLEFKATMKTGFSVRASADGVAVGLGAGGFSAKIRQGSLAIEMDKQRITISAGGTPAFLDFRKDAQSRLVCVYGDVNVLISGESSSLAVLSRACRVELVKSEGAAPKTLLGIAGVSMQGDVSLSIPFEELSKSFSGDWDPVILNSLFNISGAANSGRRLVAMFDKLAGEKSCTVLFREAATLQVKGQQQFTTRDASFVFEVPETHKNNTIGLVCHTRDGAFASVWTGPFF